jgi:hypothetical protein
MVPGEVFLLHLLQLLADNLVPFKTMYNWDCVTMGIIFLKAYNNK